MFSFSLPTHYYFTKTLFSNKLLETQCEIAMLIAYIQDTHRCIQQAYLCSGKQDKVFVHQWKIMIIGSGRVTSQGSLLRSLSIVMLIFVKIGILTEPSMTVNLPHTFFPFSHVNWAWPIVSPWELTPSEVLPPTFLPPDFLPIGLFAAMTFRRRKLYTANNFSLVNTSRSNINLQSYRQRRWHPTITIFSIFV